MKTIRRILLLFVVCCSLGVCLFYQKTSPKRLRNRYKETVLHLCCISDEDQDGIADQQDIFESALAYINTRPKYKSRYYACGYPDDGYGTCTDVVGFALLGAGYNLMDLVAEDIEQNPSSYNDPGDHAIAFRRVRNLRIYFSRHAQSLTLDPMEITEWQAGDIVIFNEHIGLISDHRNADGIPYVIHHANPFQLRYEEDILGKRKDITGHYRIGEYNEQ